MTMTLRERAELADPEKAADLALILLQIYEADRTRNNGAINGEAVLCNRFSIQAYHVLTNAGVLDHFDE